MDNWTDRQTNKEQSDQNKPVTVPHLPVTQRNMNPSSCIHGKASRLISSSCIVPYGSSMWMSHGGSAIITAHLPSTFMSKCRRSHCIHCNTGTVMVIFAGCINNMLCLDVIFTTETNILSYLCHGVISAQGNFRDIYKIAKKKKHHKI